MADAASHSVPLHVAIIMDGNGRWATRRLLPRTAGHAKGVQAVRRVVEACGRAGVRYLTLFAFSSENWRRPAEEVSDLMGLLRFFIRRDLAELHENGVNIRIIGEREQLAPDIVTMIEDAEQLTRNNTRLRLIIAFNYGGQNEIASAMRRVAVEVKAGRIQPEDVNPDVVARYLDTAGVPDPDLVIRTSGEKRLSNFLIWQSAYSELVFTDTLWPDFSPARFAEAIAEYNARDRRFGGRKEDGAS